MPKPLLIDRWTLAFLDPKTGPPADRDRVARILNHSALKRQLLTAVQAVLRVIPELRTIRLTLNPIPPFGG